MIDKNSCIKGKMVDQILKEIKIQSYLNHSNILKLYGIFEDDSDLYMILEYAPHGELYAYMKTMVLNSFNEA